MPTFHLACLSLPVHRCAFTGDGFRVASFSDDRSVALWDVGGEARLLTLSGHTDYVRAGTCSPAAPDTLVSGGYDHAVRVWDARAAACTAVMEHGAPVEAVLVFPSGGLVVSAGGTEVRVWDLAAGGAPAQPTQPPQQDGHLSLFDTASYQLVHTLEYPSPVLSLAIGLDDSKIVVGMADGLVSIEDRRREEARPRQPLRIQLDKYDLHLRRFEFSRALDAVLEREVALRSAVEAHLAYLDGLLALQGSLDMASLPTTSPRSDAVGGGPT
ncbi:U3 small nucleolar RNA-associated protein 15 homolog [Pollicipes pollicipes]|uniref:U3 small nucleolar RNA-associated protein 15 homolog n=1 Tax=Pollicipes pollicipes TaxID=41117 RepID=UPI0018850333|nr:U3 small nucleolar RNA-associated protein 15 homolog [Pollicipes pollicipes]